MNWDSIINGISKVGNGIETASYLMQSSKKEKAKFIAQSAFNNGLDYTQNNPEKVVNLLRKFKKYY